MQRNINTRLIVKMQVRGREAGQDYRGGIAEGGAVQGPRRPVVTQPGTQDREVSGSGVCNRNNEKEEFAEPEEDAEEGGSRLREESLSVERGRPTIR